MDRNLALMLDILEAVARQSTLTLVEPIALSADFKGYPSEIVYAHLRMGAEAGLFRTVPSPYFLGLGAEISGLTWEGYNVLDRLRSGRPL